MLGARGRLEVGPVGLAVEVLLERRFRIYSFERRGTLWDSRLAPVQRGPAPSEHFLILSLEGSFVWEGPRVERYTGQAAFLASDAVLEGEHGRQRWTFATWGEPYRAIYLHADGDAFAAPSPDGPVHLELPAEVWAAAHAYADAARGGDALQFPATRALLEQLHRCSVLASPLHATIVDDEGLRALLWNKLSPFFRDVILSPLLKEVADTSQLAPRNIGRILAELNLPWRNWRASTVAARIRIALLLLSSPDLPVQEIASRIGYSSAEALNHALRKAGCASPSEMRALLAERAHVLGV